MSRFDAKIVAQAIRELVPALVQVVGLLIFIVTAAAWLAFGRAEPELMGIGITTACGGWLAQSIQERLSPPPKPPPAPAPELLSDTAPKDAAPDGGAA